MGESPRGHSSTTEVCGLKALVLNELTTVDMELVEEK